MKKILALSLTAIWLFCGLCHAETLTIPPEDIKDITIANLQNQVTSQNVVIKLLLQKTGCKITQQGQIDCPDEKKDEPKKSN